MIKYYTLELNFSFDQQSKVDLHIIRECVLSARFYGSYADMHCNSEVSTMDQLSLLSFWGR